MSKYENKQGIYIALKHTELLTWASTSDYLSIFMSCHLRPVAICILIKLLFCDEAMLNQR